MEYMIIQAGSTQKLVETVQQLLAQDWKPLGGPIIMPEGNIHWPAYAQAMVREQKERAK